MASGIGRRRQYDTLNMDPVLAAGQGAWQSERYAPLDDLRRRRPEIMALAGKCRARKIAVFGSLVRGETRPDSDIDFLVEFERGYKLRRPFST